MSSVFEEIICCDLCETSPENSLQIPCFHFFCKSCLVKNIVDSILVCPVCKVEHSIPDESIEEAFGKNVLSKFWSNWHRNYFDSLKTTEDEISEINGLCEECLLKSSKKQKNKVQPEECLQRIKDCFHCEKKLCEPCRNEHYNVLRQETFKCLESYQEGSRNLSIISESLNETRLRKIAEYEKLKSDITNKKDELIKKIQDEEKEILSKLENEIKEDRMYFFRQLTKYLMLIF